MKHPFTETIFLCRTIWPDGEMGLDGGTTTDIFEVREWLLASYHDGRTVRVDRIMYDSDGAPETVRDVTDEIREAMADDLADAAEEREAAELSAYREWQREARECDL